MRIDHTHHVIICDNISTVPGKFKSYVKLSIEVSYDTNLKNQINAFIMIKITSNISRTVKTVCIFIIRTKLIE